MPAASQPAGAANGLAITHQQPDVIEPSVDLVLRFTISGDCETESPSVTKGPPTYGAGATVEVSTGCKPLAASASYIAGGTSGVVPATLGLPDAGGARPATLTIPGVELTPGSSLTYRLFARQERPYTRAGAAVAFGQLHFIPLPHPAITAPTQGTTVLSASWGPRTIKVSGDPTPCAPSAPVLSGVGGDGRIDLSWTVASEGCAAITAYKLFKGSPINDLPLYEVYGPGTQYSMWNLPNGYTSYWQVSAVNSFGEGSRSTVVSVRTVGAPRAPTLTGETGPAGNQLTWPWSAWNEQGSPSTSFKVYRGTSATQLGPLASIGSVSTSNAYLDATANNGVEYFYAVSAVNAVGEGARSNVTSLVTDLSPAPPAPIITSPVTGALQPRAIRVTGTAEPNIGIEIHFDSMNVGTTVADDRGRWNATIDAWPEGSHIVYARAYTANGQRSPSSNVVEVDVDAGRPNGEIRTIDDTENNPLLDDETGLTGSAWDNRAVKLVKLRYTDSNGVVVREVTAECTCGGREAEFRDDADLPPGKYNVVVWVEDEAGNTSGWISPIGDVVLV